MKNRNLLIGLLVLLFGAGVFVLTPFSANSQVVKFPATGIGADNATDGLNYLNLIRSNQVTGNINPADVFKARKQFSELKSGSALGLNWQSMGPDNYSGRTRAVILDNRVSSRSTIYAGSVAGGLWKSTTRGLTWSQIETGNVLLNVSCMAQAPNGDIYVGTGESFGSERFNLFTGIIGHGIYKSTDGNSFSLLSSTDPGSFNNPDAEWAYVNKLAANADRVFAATNAGLKYSSDGGNSWALAKAGDENLSEASTEVKIGPDGAVAASVGNKLYISANGDVNAFVLRSTGMGSDSLPMTGLSRIEVAWAPTDASTIYAVLISDGSESSLSLGDLQGVYVSKDKGVSWRLIGPGGSSIFNVFYSSGDYAASIEVNLTNPDQIYLGGAYLWEGTKILESGFYEWKQKSIGEAGYRFHSIVCDPVNSGMFYFATDLGVSASEDNLDTYKDLNKNYLTSMFYTVGFDDKGRGIGGSQGNGIVFLDQNGNTPETGNRLLYNFVGGTVEMSMINPTSIFYSGTSGFMTRSADLGVSEANDFVPTTISSANTGIFITPFRCWESFDNQNSRDSVGFRATQNYAAGDEIIVKSKTAYSSSQKFPFKYVLTEDVAKGDSIRIKDVISSRFFLGVTNAVYMTKEVLDFSKEPKWFKIAAITGIPSCLAYSSDANYLFVGTTDGKLIRVANMALAYDSIRADVSSTSCIISSSVIRDFEGRYITSVSVDPNDDSKLIVTLGNYGNTDYIYRSANSLDEVPVFTSVQGNLPAMPIYSSLIEMSNSNRVLVGTDLGVFSTESLGSNTSWTAENDGMGAVPVMMIRQQTVNRPWISNITNVNNLGAIYIATQGKGLYENRLYVGIDTPDVPGSQASSGLRIYPNPVRSEINVDLSLDRSCAVSARIYNLNGEAVLSVEPGTMNKGKHTLTIPAANLNQGTYLLQVVSGREVKSAKFVVVK